MANETGGSVGTLSAAIGLDTTAYEAGINRGKDATQSFAKTVTDARGKIGGPFPGNTQPFQDAISRGKTSTASLVKTVSDARGKVGSPITSNTDLFEAGINRGKASALSFSKTVSTARGIVGSPITANTDLFEAAMNRGKAATLSFVQTVQNAQQQIGGFSASSGAYGGQLLSFGVAAEEAKKRTGGFGAAVVAAQAKLRGSAQGVAQLSTVVGALSGTFAGAGIQAQALTKGLQVASSAALGLIGPVGLVALAVGALAAVWIHASVAEKKYRDAANETTDALIQRLKQAGANTDAEKELLTARLNAIRAELLLARVRQQLMQAEGTDQMTDPGFWTEVGLGIKTAAQNLGQFSKQQRVYAEQFAKISGAKGAAEFAAVVKEIDDLQVALTDTTLALDGGQDALDAAADAARAAEEAARKHAQALKEQATALKQSEDRILVYKAATLASKQALLEHAIATKAATAETIKFLRERAAAENARAIKVAPDDDARLNLRVEASRAAIEAIHEELEARRAAHAEQLKLAKENAESQFALIKLEQDAKQGAIDESSVSEKQKLKETAARRAAATAEVKAMYARSLNDQTALTAAFHETELQLMLEAADEKIAIQDALREKIAADFEDLRALSHALVDAFTSDWEDWGDFMDNLMDNILGIIRDRASKALDDIFDTLIEEAAKSKSFLSLLFGGGGQGGGEGSPDFVGPPRPLAQGGIVTKPTFALIGEAGPEAVIPLRKLGKPPTLDHVLKLIRGGEEALAATKPIRQAQTSNPIFNLMDAGDEALQAIEPRRMAAGGGGGGGGIVPLGGDTHSIARDVGGSAAMKSTTNNIKAEFHITGVTDVRGFQQNESQLLSRLSVALHQKLQRDH